MRRYFSVLGFVLLAGCGRGGSPQTEVPKPLAPLAPLPSEPPRVEAPPAKVTDVLSYKDLATHASEKARIFLVAGGKHNANFAQEVVDQKKLFESAYPAEEVVCYYTIPPEKEFKGDEKQYRELAKDLSSCYPADPARIYGDLMRSGKAGGEFLYLYVTSHGMEPLEYMLDKPISAAQKDMIRNNIEFAPFINQYHIAVDALSNGTAANLNARVEKVLRDGEEAEKHFFTPRYLKSALGKWHEKALKNVVIQACHSGGFIDSDRAAFKKDVIAGMPNTTVLTASRYDRSSFGCQPGTDRTYYGEVYGNMLTRNFNHVPDIKWDQVYEQVKEEIAMKESKLLATIRGATPSLPQFATTVESLKPTPKTEPTPVPAPQPSPIVVKVKTSGVNVPLVIVPPAQEQSDNAPDADSGELEPVVD